MQHPVPRPGLPPVGRARRVASLVLAAVLSGLLVIGAGPFAPAVATSSSGSASHQRAHAPAQTGPVDQAPATLVPAHRATGQHRTHGPVPGLLRADRRPARPAPATGRHEQHPRRPAPLHRRATGSRAPPA